MLAALLAASAWHGAHAQSLDGHHEQYRYRAIYVENPPTVDGDLSDAAWQEAPLFEPLIQQFPAFGQPITEKTEVRLVYDSAALYIAAYCYDSSPSGIVRNILQYRDDSVWMKDDIIRFGLDTFHDHRRAYVFSINPLGTKQDAQVDNELWHSNWNEVWDARTRLQKDGWTVEVRIPFRILRFPSGGDAVWGLNMQRSIKRKNETSFWSPIPPGVSWSRVSTYGHLEGLSAIEAQRNRQVIPYGLFGVTRSSREGMDSSTTDAGADLKLTLTPSLALDFTVNPNFAQVESDDQQVNLSRFSLFFPEKREFFLENAQLFDFGIAEEMQLFFSRRIGLAGGQQVPIWGGARLSGRAGAFDLGLISTQTRSQANQLSTNLSALRFRGNVGRRSYIGGILTSVSSDATSSRSFGPDALVWLGENFRWQGFLGLLDDPDITTRPLTYSSQLIYDEDSWGLNLSTFRVDNDFKPALGFVRRAGIGRQQGKVRRGWRLNRSFARKLDLSGEVTYITRRHGEPQGEPQGELDTRQWVLEASDELNSGDIVRVKWERRFERLHPNDPPFVIHPRQEVVVPAGDYPFSRWLVSWQGFDGRALVVKATLEGGEFYNGDNTALALSGIWRASPHLVLTADYELNKIALTQAAFNTHLWRGRFSVPFTARATADAFLQLNSLADEFNTQLRFHWIYAQDSNLFVVFTEQRSDRGRGRSERDRALQVKINYRFYF